MASALNTEKIFSKIAIAMYDHDPGATTAIICSGDGGTTKNYVDMLSYGRFGVEAMLSVIGSSSGMTLLEIVACAATNFSSVVVVKTTGTIAADAVGDYAVLECTAEEIAQLATDNSAALRYAAARITCSNAGDECVVTYILAEPRFAYSGLTATTISA
uniref:Uncharacterized protein n=1 Tax=viral metagenome TaxID=1070528 RepID=A0A6M3L7Y8_9ZZZZ